MIRLELLRSYGQLVLSSFNTVCPGSSDPFCIVSYYMKIELHSSRLPLSKTALKYISQILPSGQFVREKKFEEKNIDTK